MRRCQIADLLDLINFNFGRNKRSHGDISGEYNAWSVNSVIGLVIIYHFIEHISIPSVNPYEILESSKILSNTIQGKLFVKLFPQILKFTVKLIKIE